MTAANSIVLLMTASLALSACTSRSPRPVQVEPQPITKDSSKNPDIVGPGDAVDPNAETVSASTEVRQADLVAANANIDLNNLKYKFSYLTKAQEDKITFDTAGKATITFRDLPAGTAGTVSLEILEGATVKFRGTAENVTLTAGQANSLKIELKAVDGGGGSNPGGGNNTTDLTLEVTLGGTGGSNPNNPPPSNPNNPNNPPPPPSNPNLPDDPVANWDGKSNQGNAKWKIVPIDG